MLLSGRCDMRDRGSSVCRECRFRRRTLAGAVADTFAFGAGKKKLRFDLTNIIEDFHSVSMRYLGEKRLRGRWSKGLL